jgi:exonuclease III
MSQPYDTTIHTPPQPYRPTNNHTTTAVIILGLLIVSVLSTLIGKPTHTHYSPITHATINKWYTQLTSSTHHPSRQAYIYNTFPFLPDLFQNCKLQGVIPITTSPDTIPRATPPLTTTQIWAQYTEYKYNIQLTQIPHIPGETPIQPPWSHSIPLQATPPYHYNLQYHPPISNRSAHQWWLSRLQRNKLMKITNGNIITTQWPHEHRPPHQAGQVTITLKNNRSLKISPINLSQMSAQEDRPETMKILTECHTTPNTLSQAYKFWGKIKHTLTATEHNLTKNKAAGLAIATPDEFPSPTIIYSDPEGRFLHTLWKVSHSLTINLMIIYGYQKDDKITNHEALQLKVITQMQIAALNNHPTILLGDFNDTLNPIKDTSTHSTNIPPQWLIAIKNNPHVTLTDVWQASNPTTPEYTYFHPKSAYQDRKDMIWVSDSLLPHITWFTNALWPVQSDHTCLAMTINITQWDHERSIMPDKAPPKPDIAPHTSPQWKTYKTYLMKLPDWSIYMPTATKWQVLQQSIKQAADKAEIYTEKNPSPRRMFFFDDKKVRTWAAVIAACNLILSSSWPTITPQQKHNAAILLQNHAHALHRYPNWYTLPLTNRIQHIVNNTKQTTYEQLNNHTKKAQTKINQQFKTRLNKLAQEDPHRLMQYIKEDSAGPTNIALDGDETLTTIESNNFQT